MKARHLMASSFGNILEWLDTGLFIYLAPFIGLEFFPAKNSQQAALFAFGVFAAGFVCRPLGSIIFGHFGDRIGRAKILIISIVLISVATLSVGLLPGFYLIGPAASVLFTLLRLIQGLSIGGEYSSIMIYLAESSPQERRGFFTSFSAVGANLGFLLATLIVILLNTDLITPAMQSSAWRLPFIFSGALGFFLFFYRLKLIETPAFMHLKNKGMIPKNPLFSALKLAPGKLFQIIGLASMGSVFYYVFFGYMPTYLWQYFNVPLQFSLSCQAGFLALMIILVPLAGQLSDLIGRKKVLFIAAGGMLLMVLPSFYLIQTHSYLFIVIILGMATFLSSLEQGATLITVVEICPLNFRSSAVAVAYNLGNTLFGGTAPFFVGLLTLKINNLAPGYYIMGVILIALMTIFFLKETYKTDLFFVTSH